MINKAQHSIRPKDMAIDYVSNTFLALRYKPYIGVNSRFKEYPEK